MEQSIWAKNGPSVRLVDELMVTYQSCSGGGGLGVVVVVVGVVLIVALRLLTIGWSIAAANEAATS